VTPDEQIHKFQRTAPSETWGSTHPTSQQKGFILLRTALITSTPAPQRGTTKVALAASNEGAARYSEEANLPFKT
jgi:hypothetical protein